MVIYGCFQGGNRIRKVSSELLSRVWFTILNNQSPPFLSSFHASGIPRTPSLLAPVVYWCISACLPGSGLPIPGDWKLKGLSDP